MNAPLQQPRLIIGLLGGIASGKSTVSGLVATFGPGKVIDADALAGAALTQCAKDGRLVAALGPKAVQKDGLPDRKGIAKQVFNDPQALRTLERLIHPAVLAAINDAVEDHRAGKGAPLLVLDVPLLIEVGLERRCDALWFVAAPDEMRFSRAEKRLGLSKAEVLEREAAQSPLDRKRGRADLVIDNAGSPDALTAQVVKGLQALGCRI